MSEAESTQRSGVSGRLGKMWSGRKWPGPIERDMLMGKYPLNYQDVFNQPAYLNTYLVQKAGDLFNFIVDAVRAMPRRPFQFGEFIRQAWFVTTASTLATILVTIPFGTVVALELGGLTAQLGAQAVAGAAISVLNIREVAPLITGLIMAGTAGTAMAADVGARKIRNEIEAMRAMGIDPVHRLVVPRVMATTVVAVILASLVTVAGIAGAYFFTVYVLQESPGTFVQQFGQLAHVRDFFLMWIKAGLAGLYTSLVACYMGFRATTGPRGVADASVQTLVVALVFILGTNLLLTQVFFLLVA